MRRLIQVDSRPTAGSAQAEMTAGKSRSTDTSKTSRRMTLRSERDGRNVSSGMIPRASGSTQKSVSSSALSAMGKMPQA